MCVGNGEHIWKYPYVPRGQPQSFLESHIRDKIEGEIASLVELRENFSFLFCNDNGKRSSPGEGTEKLRMLGAKSL